ncbi:MAG TPA: sigma-70 family RNA polymerase sigma factor, partial [Gemmataceae bacterium]|nr:sigma-70 family RNA polymerase sigma factor [Gemmataceae bacterium]
MIRTPAQVLRQQLQRLADAQAGAGDADALRRHRAGDPGALADLVHRHGPMVYGVCRRVLGPTPDADDAFQATFLALVRHPAAVRNPSALPAWLHRVALRTARKALAQRKPVREPADTAASSEPGPADRAAWADVRRALDEELNRLPDSFRSALVLCYLDGATRDEAARRLGWTVATLDRRLAAGRARLRARLARRGLGALALGCAVLAADGLRATVPLHLLQAAAHLGDRLRRGALPPGVVAATLPSRTPVIAGLSVALAAVALTLGGWWTQAANPKPAGPKADEAPRATTTFEKRPFWWGSEAFRHNGWILDSDLSADGRLLATASWDSFVVWELATRKKLLHVQETESVSSVGRDRISVVRLSPDGKQLATANKSLGTVRVWDVATGKHLATIGWDRETERAALEKVGLKPFERHKHFSYQLAIEYVDDTRLLIQSGYFTTTWDTVRNSRAAVEYHPVVADFGLTKDRKRVLRSRESSGNDGIRPALVLWDVAAGKAVREFPTDQRIYETAAALSDDQRFLAVTRKAGSEIAVWDWPADKEVGVLEFVPEREYDFIRTMVFAPDGKALYVGTSTGNLVVFDLTTKTKARSWRACPNNLMRIHFAPGGDTIHTGGGDGLARQWRLPDGKAVPVPEGYVGQPVFAWSRARNTMAVGDEQGRIDLWDATGARITRTLETKGEPIVQLAFSRSGRLLAASDGKGWTRLWSLESGEQLAKFGGNEESSGWLYNVLAISDDETRLLVRTGYSVKMYRIPEGKELWLAPPKQMAMFALSPNGKVVCASSFEGSIALYDANTFGRPKPLQAIPDLGFPSYEARFTFSPDSRVLALGTPKGKILFFDSGTGKHLGDGWTGDEQLHHLVYTADGTFLIAVGHGKAYLFDALSFEKLSEAPIDAPTIWRYREATPGGPEKLLTLFRPADLPKADLEACWKKLDSGRPKEVLEAIWQMSQAADLGPFL